MLLKNLPLRVQLAPMAGLYYGHRDGKEVNQRQAFCSFDAVNSMADDGNIVEQERRASKVCLVPARPSW